MKVILQEKVANLGNVGDLVTVKPGYGRNYLIPYGRAVQATEENTKAFELRRADFERKEAEKLSEAQKRAEKFNDTTLKLAAKASEEGKLFGSITPRDITEAAEKAGIDLHKNEVRMPEGPIRNTGEYTIEIALHSEVTAQVKIIVEAEK